MILIERATIPEPQYHNEIDYELLKTKDGEYLVRFTVLYGNLTDKDFKLFGDVVGFDIVEWEEYGSLAKVSLHFPESTYGS